MLAKTMNLRKLNNLSGNVRSFIRYSWYAVRDDCATFWNREKKFVVHPDVSGKHDAICYLQIFKFQNISLDQAFAVFSIGPKVLYVEFESFIWYNHLCKKKLRSYHLLSLIIKKSSHHSSMVSMAYCYWGGPGFQSR